MTKPETETDTPQESEPSMPAFEDILEEATINVAIQRRWELAQEVKALEAEIKVLSAQILTTLTDRQLTTLEAGDHVATIVTTTRTSLSERKLMDRGIPLHILKECKDTSTTRYVKVSQREGKEPEIRF